MGNRPPLPAPLKLRDPPADARGQESEAVPVRGDRDRLLAHERQRPLHLQRLPLAQHLRPRKNNHKGELRVLNICHRVVATFLEILSVAFFRDTMDGKQTVYMKLREFSSSLLIGARALRANPAGQDSWRTIAAQCKAAHSHYPNHDAQGKHNPIGPQPRSFPAGRFHCPSFLPIFSG